MDLKTNNGHIFLIDDEDYCLLKNMTFYLHPQGYINCYDKILKKNLRVHRVIMNVYKTSKPMIDHINMNKSDNRKCNLRFCTNSENQKNKMGHGKSKYIGVSIHVSTRKYMLRNGEFKNYISKPNFKSSIVKDGKQHHLGLFKNEIDAAKCYNEAAAKYHGEFANLNTFEDQ